MCTALMGGGVGKRLVRGDKSRPRRIHDAADVPLGDGMADSARTSILERRQRIRDAVNQADQ